MGYGWGKLRLHQQVFPLQIPAAIRNLPVLLLQARCDCPPVAEGGSMRFVTVVCALVGMLAAFAAAQAVPVLDRSCPVQVGPVPHKGQPPTDDSMWVVMDSVPIGTSPRAFWRGLCLDPNGVNFWVMSGDDSTIVQKRDLATGSLVSSFLGHALEGPYGIIRFGDSLCVTCFNAGHFDIYDTLGNLGRTMSSPVGNIRGIDWDGSKFWATSTASLIIFTMSRSGALLKTLTPTVAPAWIGSFTLDRTVPNRVWVAPSTGGNDNIHYCSFDTSANTYTILATFNQPTGGGGYPGGLAFLGPVSGGSFIYDIGRSGTWLWRVKVHEPQGYKVILAFSDLNTPQYAAQLAQTLGDSSGGEFLSVDTFNVYANAAFPAAATYAAGYRAIMIYTNNPPMDTIQIGDSLAAFIEAGGGVVDLIASMISPYGLRGRYRTQYSPFPMTSTYTGSDTMSLVHNPSHPIMNGVTRFGYTGSLGGNNAHGSLRGPNSVCLAEYSHSNRTVVACFDSGGHRAAGIGIFPLWHYMGNPNTGQWVRLYVNALKWVAGSSTGIEEPEARPENRLASCGANPFRNEARVGYALPRATRVSLTVFTAAGRLVRTLADGTQAPGLHQAVWDGRDDNGRDAGRGVYYCRLQAGGLGGTTKLVKIE